MTSFLLMTQRQNLKNDVSKIIIHVIKYGDCQLSMAHAAVIIWKNLQIITKNINKQDQLLIHQAMSFSKLMC